MTFKKSTLFARLPEAGLRTALGGTGLLWGTHGVVGTPRDACRPAALARAENGDVKHRCGDMAMDQYLYIPFFRGMNIQLNQLF